MPARRSLPTELLARPFTVAEGAAAGLSADVLRGRRFWAPARGVRASTQLADTLQLRCAALALLVPGAVFSHATAARLCRLPVPEHMGDNLLEISVVGARPRTPNVRVHDCDVGDDVHLMPDGTRVTTGRRTWADLATELAIDDLVILGDAILRHGWGDVPGLGELADRRGRRGVRRMRAALPLLETRTDSPMETRLRLLIVRSGLPRPVAGRDVVVDGCWLARPDLSWPDLRLALEYDGDHHRTDRRQWQRDIARRRSLEDAGWTLVVVTADDVLRHSEALVERLRAAILRGTHR